MRFLLDTHVWIWWLGSPELLSAQTRAILADPESELSLSAASVWEMAIKVSIGKLQLPGPIDVFVPGQLSQDGIQLLPVQLSHALKVASLPHHHRDPFDRMLLAQAEVESLALITADPLLKPYGVRLVWAG